jgi:5'-methylthioadenosine phosphorylase
MGAVVGVIGGTGLYEMEGLANVEEIRLDTPFGEPSGPYLRGTLEGADLVFLPRHGRGHRLLPTEINARANLFGMKQLGVERLLSVSAVGSLREEIGPGDIVIPDQFIDRTSKRPSTFFGDGIVAHVQFADPFCESFRTIVIQAANDQGIDIHPRGTYVCMEGPQFSTRAESKLYRSWGADLIGMTNLQEAKLAREAEICFATIALATDYDCWNQVAGDVDIGQVIQILNRDVELAQRIIRGTVRSLSVTRGCACESALENAIVTDRAVMPPATIEKLYPLIKKYVSI